MTVINLKYDSEEHTELKEIKNKLGTDWSNAVATCMYQTDFFMKLCTTYGLGDITDLNTSRKIADALEFYASLDCNNCRDINED